VPGSVTDEDVPTEPKLDVEPKLEPCIQVPSDWAVVPAGQSAGIEAGAEYVELL